MNIQTYIDNFLPLVIEYGIKVIMALLVFVIGKWVVKHVSALVRSSMMKGGIDGTVSTFASNLTNGLLMAFVIIAALAQLGIQTASFVAIIGAAGLAVGLALQGSLANFASGVLIILLRPFKQGDFVDAAGVSGNISNISIFSTVLKTPDNKNIIVPNSSMMSGAITNYSTEATRRVDLVVGVSYEADIRKVKQVLNDIIASNSHVLTNPAPTVAVSELGDSSVNFVVRPWVDSTNYWPARFDILEQIKIRLDEESIAIPYPQMDVHVFKDGS